MQRFIGWSGAVALVGLLIAAAAVWADEEKVSLDKLPKPVVAALKARFPGAELKSADKEKDGDKIIYDVALKHKGVNYEASVTLEGEITTFEKEITAKDLPKKVVKALEDKYPKATYKYKLIEEVYKVKGKKEELESYEVALEAADGKKLEVLVAPDGKYLKGGDAKEDKK
jgi:hypothetical protein